MNTSERKALAKNLESDIDSILDEFNRVLEKRGLENVEVISFALGPKEESTKFKLLSGSPCPTKCVVLPNGQIECKPVC